MNQPPQQLPPGINPDDFPNHKCGKCGSDIFLPGVIMKTVPVTHPKNPHGKEMSMMIPQNLCIKCVVLGCLTEWRNALVKAEKENKS